MSRIEHYVGILKALLNRFDVERMRGSDEYRLFLRELEKASSQLGCLTQHTRRMKCLVDGGDASDDAGDASDDAADELDNEESEVATGVYTGGQQHTQKSAGDVLATIAFEESEDASADDTCNHSPVQPTAETPPTQTHVAARTRGRIVSDNANLSPGQGEFSPTRRRMRKGNLSQRAAAEPEDAGVGYIHTSAEAKSATAMVTPLMHAGPRTRRDSGSATNISRGQDDDNSVAFAPQQHFAAGRPLQSPAQAKRAQSDDNATEPYYAAHKPVVERGVVTTADVAKRTSAALKLLSLTNVPSGAKRAKTSARVIEEKVHYDERGYVVLCNFYPEHRSIPLDIDNKEQIIFAGDDATRQLARLKSIDWVKDVEDNLQELGIMDEKRHVLLSHSVIWNTKPTAQQIPHEDFDVADNDALKPFSVLLALDQDTRLVAWPAGTSVETLAKRLDLTQATSLSFVATFAMPVRLMRSPTAACFYPTTWTTWMTARRKSTLLWMMMAW